jgi:hypothetical protein
MLMALGLLMMHIAAGALLAGSREQLPPTAITAAAAAGN